MKEYEPTALCVYISGKGAPSGNPKCVGFRADMDALPMVEKNEHLEYRSKNEGKAHMCGHDGHMACLVGFVPLFLKRLGEVPSDRKIKLLFQPSEEGPGSGAKKMVEDGCLDDVDEVYGFHNWPSFPAGQILCKEGPVMSEVTTLKIWIHGTGGHGSEPEKLKESVRAGNKFYSKAMDYLDEVKAKYEGKFVSTIPVFQAGEACNVISETCFITGTIRSFVKGLSQEVVEKLESFLKDLTLDGFKYEFKWSSWPMVVNTEKEADHVLRIGKKVFGEENAHSKGLPVRASEDFCYFNDYRPGAFFFVGTGIEPNQPFLHNAGFNFNDEVIPKACLNWLELALDRLQ